MKKVILFLMILSIIILPACTTEDEHTFEAMDTVMSMTVYGDEDVCDKLEARAHALDGILSSTDPDSEIYQLNKVGKGSLSDDALTLVQRSLVMSSELKDYYDPTVYPAVCVWGFIDGKYRVPDKKRLAQLAENIDSSAVKVDDDAVTLPRNMTLDLGASAKGYLAHECRSILADSEATGAVLNLGGTVLLYGKKPDGSDFKVGVADPDKPADYFGYLSCGEGVVATSGGYERYFEKDGKRYIHILDPTTAAPVDNGVLSVTVFSRDGTLADILSTALFVMGADKAKAYYQSRDDFEFILLTDDDKLYVSEGISDQFTLSDGYSYDITTVKRK